MAQRVQPRILGAAVRRDDAGGDLRRMPDRPDDRRQADRLTAASPGNTRSASFRGHASRHSRSAFTTIGSSGTVRRPAADLSGPMVPNRSARWRTCSSLRARSTSAQRRPRNSEARNPVKIAVSSSGRSRTRRRHGNDGAHLVRRRNVDTSFRAAASAACRQGHCCERGDCGRRSAPPVRGLVRRSRCQRAPPKFCAP